MDEERQIDIAIPNYTETIKVNNLTLNDLISKWKTTYRDPRTENIPTILSGDELIRKFIQKNNINEEEYKKKNQDFLKKSNEIKGSYRDIKHGEIIEKFKKEIKKINSNDISIILQWRDTGNFLVIFSYFIQVSIDVIENLIENFQKFGVSDTETILLISLGFQNDKEKYALIDGNHRICALSFLGDPSIQLTGTIIYPCFDSKQLIGIASYSLHKTHKFSKYGIFDQLSNFRNVLQKNENTSILGINERTIQKMTKVISFLNEKGWKLLREYNSQQFTFSLNALYQPLFIKYDNEFSSLKITEKLYTIFLENAIQKKCLSTGGEKLITIASNIVSNNILSYIINPRQYLPENSKVRDYMRKLNSDFHDDPTKSNGFKLNENADTKRTLHYQLSLFSHKLYLYYNETIPKEIHISSIPDSKLLVWKEQIQKFSTSVLIDKDPLPFITSSDEQLPFLFKDILKKPKIESTNNPDSPKKKKEEKNTPPPSPSTTPSSTPTKNTNVISSSENQEIIKSFQTIPNSTFNLPQKINVLSFKGKKYIEINQDLLKKFITSPEIPLFSKKTTQLAPQPSKTTPKLIIENEKKRKISNNNNDSDSDLDDYFC